MDIGGSMMPFSRICSRLFSAVHKSANFKDLKFYYFHNCIYDLLYNDATINPKKAVKTKDILSSLSSDYKIVIVGDAAMAPNELLAPDGIIFWESVNDEPGITWLQRLAKKFPYCVWLNPIREQYWETIYGSETIKMVRDIFPMYELTLKGLDEAIKKLMVKNS